MLKYFTMRRWGLNREFTKEVSIHVFKYMLSVTKRAFDSQNISDLYFTIQCFSETPQSNYNLKSNKIDKISVSVTKRAFDSQNISDLYFTIQCFSETPQSNYNLKSNKIDKISVNVTKRAFDNFSKCHEKGFR